MKLPELPLPLERLSNDIGFYSVGQIEAYGRACAQAAYEDAASENEALREALADIAYSDDMDAQTMRNKARRVYESAKEQRP